MKKFRMIYLVPCLRGFVHIPLSNLRVSSLDA